MYGHNFPTSRAALRKQCASEPNRIHVRTAVVAPKPTRQITKAKRLVYAAMQKGASFYVRRRADGRFRMDASIPGKPRRQYIFASKYFAYFDAVMSHMVKVRAAVEARKRAA
jgi:hypothetical protein